MAIKNTLRAKGLYTDPNLLSGVPEGAMVEANNVIIDRTDVVEPRRGFAKYGETFGIGGDTADQLLNYKDRILIHFNDELLYNSVDHSSTSDGLFFKFDGSYNPTEEGLRIKYAESNRNLYFTTDDGIKKISANTAADFTTATGYIRDAGAFKALDVTGQLNFESEGFLAGNSKTAYRVVWGYRDANDNLILGSPSPRLVLTNFSTVSANVDLDFVIPTGLTDDYFYQIYRTATFTATGNITLDDIDPGDEMNLVIEDFPTAAQLTTGSISVTDIAPEDFRQNGLPLYTNPNSGDGIGQANEPPPKAKDITMYQNTLFYANTETRANTTISLLGVGNLVNGSSQLLINSDLGTETYTFVGDKENTTIDFSSYTGTIPTDLDGKYWLKSAASNKRKYYIWYDNTKTTQTLSFVNYIGTIPSELDGRYVVVRTSSDRIYYVWYDATGTTADPGDNPNNGLTGFIGIRVDISSGVTTKAEVADATATSITTNNVFNDFDIVYTATDEFLAVETESFDETGITSQETIQRGFSYTINTPTDDNPSNTPLVNTDVVGRLEIRVNVSRNITTKQQLADATAAAFLEQDSALDFNVTYSSGDDFLTIENTNNGNTDDATDSAVEGLGNGFSILVNVQGDGEDAANNDVLLSDAPTPSQQIDETARSIVNIINSNSLSAVNAFYLSGPNDLPGQILLQVRDIGTNSFNVEADSATTGALFNPSLPPSPDASPVEGLPEIKPNRIYYAKVQQPEAVPLLNFIDIGPEDKEISRILALRESLFILKEDGVYRLTGLDGNFTVDLFDNTTKIIAPDSAVVLNNQIYCLTNNGVVFISDTGIQIITKDLDNLIQNITSSNFNFRLTSFGVAYETDRAYLLFLPSSENDTVATQCLRYNTATQTWTKFTITKTCGVVNDGDDKLYLGASDENFIERERKNFNRTDYADREFEINIPSTAVDGTTLTLSQSGAAVAGDALVQTQFVTIKQYNQLLKKLDLDPFTGAKEAFTVSFAGYTGTIPGDLHSKYFLLNSASDAVRYSVFYDAVGNLEQLDQNVFTEVVNTQQIRVDVSSGVTTVEELASRTQNAIRTATRDFVVNYIPGNNFFDAETVRSGETTDPSDSQLNPVASGFSIVVTTQGFGDYLDTQQAFPGDNLKNKIDELAIKLDNDPNVVASDFLSAVDEYNASGSTATLGTPTVITEVGHGLQTGRLITISNSTTIPSLDGDHVVTRIDNDTFSVEVETTSSGLLDWAATTNRFEDHQGMFNTIVNKVNTDSGILYSNYPLSQDSCELEVLITSARPNTPVVEVEFSLDYITGPVTLFKGIICDVLYAPETIGDPSVVKHIRDGSFLFENATFTGGTVGYQTDKSPGVSEIPFNKSGKGDWGNFVWGNQNWGGGFSGVPLRTYIPLGKQRCRYIQAFFEHRNSREKWAIFGISYVYRGISDRTYRG